MKYTTAIPFLAMAVQLVSGHPLTTRALGGTVVIRQWAKNSDAFIDTTVTIDLDGDRTPQALESKSAVKIRKL